MYDLKYENEVIYLYTFDLWISLIYNHMLI